MGKRRAAKPKLDPVTQVPRSVKFFLLSRRKRKGKTPAPVDLGGMLQTIADKPFEVRGRIYEEVDGKKTAAWIDEAGSAPFRFKLGTLRATDWPIQVGRDGKISALRAAGYLGEISHFVAYPHRFGFILACEVSRGPRASGVAAFLHGVLGEQATDLEVEGIYGAGLATRLRALDDIVVGRIKALRKDIDRAAKSTKDPLVGGLADAADAGDLRSFDVILRPVGDGAAMVDAMKRAAEGLDVSEAEGRGAPLVRVTGYSGQAGRQISVDLMEHMIVAQTAMLRERKGDRMVDSANAYDVLAETYTARRSEIEAGLQAARATQ